MRDLEDLARERRVCVPVARRGKCCPVHVGPALGGEVALEQRVAPRAVAVSACPDLEDGQRVVGPDDHRVGMFLEHLHRHAIVSLVELEDELRPREVDVALVPGADLLDRQAERLRPQPISDDHVLRSWARIISAVVDPSCDLRAVPGRSASWIRSTCFGAVFGGSSSTEKYRTSSASSLVLGVPDLMRHSKLKITSIVRGFQYRPVSRTISTSRPTSS